MQPCALGECAQIKWAVLLSQNPEDVIFIGEAVGAKTVAAGGSCHSSTLKVYCPGPLIYCLEYCPALLAHCPVPYALTNLNLNLTLNQGSMSGAGPVHRTCEEWRRIGHGTVGEWCEPLAVQYSTVIAPTVTASVTVCACMVCYRSIPTELACDAQYIEARMLGSTMMSELTGKGKPLQGAAGRPMTITKNCSLLLMRCVKNAKNFSRVFI